MQQPCPQRPRLRPGPRPCRGGASCRQRRAPARRRGGGGAVCMRASVIRQIQADIGSGARSAEGILQQYRQRLQAAEPHVHSFLAVAEGAGAGGPSPAGPLTGVVLAIKDNLCARGLPTTAGSAALRGYLPAEDAAAVARLRAAGATLLGKANCDAFGMGSTTETSDYQATRNPWDLERVPGGSSGGSAAAVAAQQCVAALGSDTGGSIRQPAHFCGVVGLKPSWGRVSRRGLVAYASSLDAVGPLTSSVLDAAILLGVIAGADSLDATSSRRPVEDYAAPLRPAADLGSQPLRGRRLGVIRETQGEGVSPGVQAAFARAVAHLQGLGAEVEEVSLPTYGLGLPAYYVLATSEASSNLARYDGTRYGPRAQAEGLRDMYDRSRAAGLGPEVQRRILMGTYALSAGYYEAYYRRAQQVRTLVCRELEGALGRCHALLSPVAPTTAYPLGGVVNDPLAMYKGDLMTVNINLAGLPALSVPCGFEEGTGLPIGLQVIGGAFQEAAILEVGHAFEQTAAFAQREPPDFTQRTGS